MLKRFAVSLEEELFNLDISRRIFVKYRLVNKQRLAGKIRVGSGINPEFF